MPQRARKISCACLNSAALVTDFSVKDFLGARSSQRGWWCYSAREREHLSQQPFQDGCQLNFSSYSEFLGTDDQNLCNGDTAILTWNYTSRRKNSHPFAKWCSSSVNAALCFCYTALLYTTHYLKSLSIKAYWFLVTFFAKSALSWQRQSTCQKLVTILDLNTIFLYWIQLHNTGFLKQHVGWWCSKEHKTALCRLPGLGASSGLTVAFLGPGEGSQGVWSHFIPASTEACGASGLGCGTGSSWGLIPHPHTGISTASAFPLGPAIADVSVQAPNSKCQSKGIGFSASQLVSTDPWDTFPEHWGTSPEKMQKYFNILSLGMCNGQGTKSTLVPCITQT